MAPRFAELSGIGDPRKNGAVAASSGAFVDVAGVPVTVVDTIGAGDTFGAAFIAALVDEAAFGPQSSRPVDEPVLGRAVAYAVAASAITCTRYRRRAAVEE
jgi:fructokinase